MMATITVAAGVHRELKLKRQLQIMTAYVHNIGNVKWMMREIESRGNRLTI